MTSTSGKFATRLISAIILFVAGWANLATAIVVEGSFTGVVTTTFISTDGSTITYDVTTPVGVQVGDHVTGYFTYDTKRATDRFPSDPTIAEYVYNPAGANSFYIEVNGLRWASGNTLSIQVENNRFFDFDGSYQSLFDIQFLDAGSSFPGNQLAGQGAVTFQVANIFNSTPNTLLSSDQLPTSLSDIDLSVANDTTVYVLSDYPTYPPGRYGFFVSLDRNSIRLAPRLGDPGLTTRVSVDSAGTQANASSFGAALSANGRFVAFASDATNLVGGILTAKRTSSSTIAAPARPAASAWTARALRRTVSAAPPR